MLGCFQLVILHRDQEDRFHTAIMIVVASVIVTAVRMYGEAPPAQRASAEHANAHITR